eukprot:670049-Amphidinium_carterae.1
MRRTHATNAFTVLPQDLCLRLWTRCIHTAALKEDVTNLSGGGVRPPSLKWTSSRLRRCNSRRIRFAVGVPRSEFPTGT